MAFNVNELTSENTPMRWRIQGTRVDGTAEESLLEANYKAVLDKAATFTSNDELGIGNQPGGDTPPILVSSVEIIGGELEVEVGATYQLTAVVTPNDAANKTVTWSSDDTASATVSATGLVTGVSEGDAVITVKANDAGGVEDTYLITVAPVLVTSVDITTGEPDTTMGQGQSITLAFTVSPANATDKTISWTSSDNAVATVNASGVVTSNSTGVRSTTTITATANGASGVTDTVLITTV